MFSNKYSIIFYCTTKKIYLPDHRCNATCMRAEIKLNSGTFECGAVRMFMWPTWTA